MCENENLEWAKTLYMHLTHEIRFFKNQQWISIYAVLIINYAIYSALKGSVIKCLIYIIILYGIISILGIVFIVVMQKSIKLNRRYLVNIKKKCIAISKIISETDEERDADLCPCKDIIILTTFILLLIMSPIFFCILLKYLNILLGSAQPILFAFG
jgi:hypothetical protein